MCSSREMKMLYGGIRIVAARSSVGKGAYLHMCDITLFIGVFGDYRSA
jgi:hypothetical protein